MVRIRLPALPDDAPAEVRDGLRTARAAFGRLTSLHRAMANAPAVLDAHLAMEAALAGGALDPRVARRVALATAEANGSDYGAAFQHARARSAGLTGAEIEAARLWHARGAKAAAALAFGEVVHAEVGHVPATALATARAAGLTDRELVEIVAQVALATMADLVATTFALEPDHPPPAPLET